MSTAPTSKRKNGTALLVRMPEDLRMVLLAHASTNDMSAAQVARRAIQSYLERQADYVAPY